MSYTPRQLKKMREEAGAWVVMKGPVPTCLRCGAVSPIKLPVPLSDLVVIVGGFVDQHLFCGAAAIPTPVLAKRRGHAQRSGLPVNTTLPAEGFVRIRTVLAVFGTTRSTLWRWIAAGQFPKGRKLTSGTTGWDVSELRDHMAKIRGADVGSAQ